MSVYIAKMNVKELRARCDKLKLNSTGLKKDLRDRLAEHYKCSVVTQEKIKGKHKCKWENKIFADACTPRPFTDADFNVESLTRLLTCFPDRMPTCGECYEFFHTEEMWELGLTCTNNYPRTIRSQLQPPPWHKSSKPWPPVWTANPWTFTMKEFKNCTAALYLLGLKHKGKDALRWCFLKDTDKCPLAYKKFIKNVADHILSWVSSAPSSAAAAATITTPVTTPTSSRTKNTPRSATVTRKPRIAPRRTFKRKLDTKPYEGPSGETRPPLKRALCVGADLCKTTKRRVNGKGFVQSACLYCLHAFEKPKKPRDTVWECELCHAPLHVGCNYKYHRWVNCDTIKKR